MLERKKTAKRSRDDEAEEETQNLRKEVEKLLKTVRELSEVTEASSKTKMEIKNNLVKKLKRQANDVDKEWKALDERQVKAKPRTETKEMRSIAVQASVEDIEREHEEKRLKITNKIQTAMQDNTNFGKLADILDLKWPQESYKVTEMEGANQIAASGLLGDYAIIADPINLDGNKLVEKLQLKYRGLKLQLKYRGLDNLIKSNEGQVDFLIQTAKIKTRRNEYD
ncbi:hypothetical protein QE152_g22491 [Popillia japonica]|uniref:Uncharacterized protein n=1 Tax=Popillia japonica TaxID=7064 RepID=A0AAW1KKP2_POPJA